MTPTSTIDLIEVDPAKLVVRDQARVDATPDEQLVASVKKFGIMQPPTVAWDPDQDRYVIVLGHRRVGAAIAAEIPMITVIVRGLADADALKLEQQIVENERRKGLTAREVAQGYANLESLFGQTPEDIATALAESPERIRAGIRAARSQKTAELLDKDPSIDLTQAATIAEFDDHPAEQKKLIETATSSPHNFSWKVEQLRKELEIEDARAVKRTELEATGVKVIKTDAYGYPSGLNGQMRALTDLVDAKGKKLNSRNHAKCPGHRAYVGGYDAAHLEARYVCIDWEAQGHTVSYGPAESAAETKERLTREAERQALDAARAANRAARREWIADLLPGKINQLPGVYDYMAAALLREYQYYGDHREPALTLELLRRDPDPGHGTAHYNEIAHEVAPFRMMLATALAIHEAEAQRARPIAGIRHFEQLQRWGYELTDLDTEALTSWRSHLEAEAARQAEIEAQAGADVDEDDEGGTTHYDDIDEDDEA
jgi:ParB/RepB/Spo0J family partition protein